MELRGRVKRDKLNKKFGARVVQQKTKNGASRARNRSQRQERRSRMREDQDATKLKTRVQTSERDEGSHFFQ